MELQGTAEKHAKLQFKSPQVVSSWCDSSYKRYLDIAGAIVLLILLFPFMLVIALAVWCTSPGPVLFRQRRTGKGGREFYILKFRTMISGRRQNGPLLTRSTDPRVTPVGRFLRRWKLDEFPQLINVLRGDMSFVGPRPHATKLWEGPEVQEGALTVLSVRPGITSDATLNFRHEEEMLMSFHADNVEDAYVKSIMPLKLNMEIEYLRVASFSSDQRIVLQTVSRIFSSPQSAQSKIKVGVPAIQRPPHPVLIDKREYAPSADQAD